MRKVLLLAAASAVLSASIFAAFASAEGSQRVKAAVVAVPEVTTVKPADACAPAAWPYGRMACTAGRSADASTTPARPVRLIQIVQR